MSSSLKHTVVFGYFLSLITHNAVLASHDNQCTYETQENRIINIQDDLGTKLLAALQMASLEHCREACCGQFYGKCNMAFYHENNTQERNCFLALCEPENECRLTTREGFSATRVKKAEKDEDPDWFLTTFLNKLENELEKENKAATPSADIPVEDTATSSSVTELASTVKATTVNSDITTAKLTKCQKEYLEAKSGPSLIGKFVPQCTETGAYSAMQCWGSTGSCWCVDENGEKLEETVMGRGKGRPNCEDATNKQRPTNKEAATQEPVEQTSKSTETTAARQTTLPSRTTTMPPEQQTTQKATTTQRTTTQRATTAQISTTRQRIEPTTRLKQTENPTEMPIKQSTELETITGEPSAASGSDTSSLSQAILEPQDSRNVELPGGNETSASLEKDKAKGGKSSYLSSNGALVAAMCFGVLFMLAVCVLVGKRWYESYQRRHYNKMDYLINGMYN